MKEQQYFTLKEVQLNNNCPECYSNEGLQLTFKQRFVENAFYKAITGDTTHEMRCNTCNTDIFPVRWTNDIEQVVAYQERAVNPKPKSTKLKKLAWIFIIADALLLIVVVLFVTGILSF
ncbi:hypothetical protein [Psychroserpens luteolus]|uniref:hypothetical protein n=1 Tax=Psychroserpens luteolus TaxID=2855840 RepID=UPI001E628839|nr:hypothetical protein [Psychroserpens luteolus]MCD2257926.1 hypothetical protein [Psychroserpens luteolus]